MRSLRVSPVLRLSATCADGLAAIYNNMFDWLVARINTSMAPRGAVTNMIGILDM